MHRAEIMRSDLKIHFKDWNPVILSGQSKIIDSIDLMPVVRLLCLVDCEKKLAQQAT